MPSPAR